MAEPVALPTLPADVAQWIRDIPNNCNLFHLSRISSLECRKTLDDRGQLTTNGVWVRASTGDDAVVRLVGELGPSQHGPYGDGVSAPKDMVSLSTEHSSNVYQPSTKVQHQSRQKTEVPVYPPLPFP
jgi:hypothetical protein